MAEPTIRPAREGDLGAIREISRVSWEGQGLQWSLQQRYGPLGGKPWIEHHFVPILRKFQEHPDWMWVTEFEGAVVGFVSCVVHAQMALGILGYNAVHPDYRDRGWGRAQIEFLMERFRRRELEYVQVIVGSNAGHDIARSLYAAQGCEKIATHGSFFSLLADIRAPQPAGVRPARPEDAAAIRALLDDALESCHPYALCEKRVGEPLG